MSSTQTAMQRFLAVEPNGAPKLRLGLPKGSLQQATLTLLAKAGFGFYVQERSYFPVSEDEEITAMLVRAQEMARYVSLGLFDAGFTGKDWVLETGADVVVVADLIYSKTSFRPVRWVLAVPEDSPIQSVHNLQGKRIATEVVNITRRWLAERGIEAEVEFSWGATEVKAPYLADAIVEVTETGTSLKANKLRIVDVVLESNTQLIASHFAWADPWKRQKIENLALLVQGAILAEGKVGLKLNCRREDVPQIVSILPSLRNPTIADLALPGWVAVETIIDEALVRQLIPELKRRGAEGIIEYPLNKIIP